MTTPRTLLTEELQKARAALQELMMHEQALDQARNKIANEVMLCHTALQRAMIILDTLGREE